MTNYPTAWQRRALWGSLTFMALTAAGTLAVWLVWQAARAVSFLQPILIPFAIAAVLAFLLEPVVRFLERRTRLRRRGAVVLLFSLMTLLAVMLGLLVVPRVYQQTAGIAQNMPAYVQQVQGQLLGLLEKAQDSLNRINRTFSRRLSNVPPAPGSSPGSAPPAAGESPAPVPDSPASPDAGPTAAPAAPGNREVSLDLRLLRNYVQRQLPELGRQVPAVLQSGSQLLVRSIGGFMGIFAVLLNAVIIPVYLYFLLVEGPNIARRWSDYLPLQDSPLKQEIVSTLTEINGYLVAFFRGQLIVSTIDGALIAVGLSILRIDFALVIGLFVIPLTFIPYLGIVLCFLPAALIALVQYGDLWHPLLVGGVILLVQNVEGTFIAPKIVGDSVGLHPLTVIISVFLWSLILDGPIGALLAIPLTASLKVLMQRYVWERARRSVRWLPGPPAVAPPSGESVPGGVAAAPAPAKSAPGLG